MEYSFIKGLKKSLLAFVLFAIPFFVTNFPELANLTLGGALVLVANYLKINYLR